MLSHETCLDCKIESPATESDTTLVSSLGWRITRTPTRAGVIVVEWRCPTCWAAHKTKTIAPPRKPSRRL